MLRSLTKCAGCARFMEQKGTDPVTLSVPAQCDECNRARFRSSLQDNPMTLPDGDYAWFSRPMGVEGYGPAV